MSSRPKSHAATLSTLVSIFYERQPFMFDLLLLIYLAILATSSHLVKYFPAPVMSDNVTFPPLGALFILICLLAPSYCGYMLPEYIRAHYFPYHMPGAFERLSRVAGGGMMFYITLRGLAVWAILCLLGIGIVATGLVLYYIF